MKTLKPIIRLFLFFSYGNLRSTCFTYPSFVDGLIFFQVLEVLGYLSDGPLASRAELHLPSICL